MPAQPSGASPATVQTSPPFDLTRSDAIRPVYPLETAIGIGVAGIAGGVGSAVRAGVGEVLRQVAPEGKPPLNKPTAAIETSEAAKTASSVVSVRKKVV